MHVIGIGAHSRHACGWLDQILSSCLKRIWTSFRARVRGCTVLLCDQGSWHCSAHVSFLKGSLCQRCHPRPVQATQAAYASKLFNKVEGS